MVSSPRLGPVAALAIFLAGLTTQVTPVSGAALPALDAQARHGAVTISHTQARPAAARPGRARLRPAAVMRPKIKPARGFALTGRPPAPLGRRGSGHAA